MFGPFQEFINLIVGMAAAGFFVSLTLSIGGVILKIIVLAFETPEGDKRKKKKDEYDAYYDERLAETEPHPLNGDIAYYEDEPSKNVVSG